MALSQPQSDERGASTTYHRIAKADIDFTTRIAKVIVYSYVNEDLRNQEKAEAASKAEYDSLMEELSGLVQDPTEDNEARRIELSEQLNTMTPIGELTPRHLTETTYTLPIDEGIELSSAYCWMKSNIDLFSDAEDA